MKYRILVKKAHIGHLTTTYTPQVRKWFRWSNLEGVYFTSSDAESVIANHIFYKMKIKRVCK